MLPILSSCLLAAAAVLVYRAVSWLVLGATVKNLDRCYTEEDLFRRKAKAWLRLSGRRFFHPALPPIAVALAFLLAGKPQDPRSFSLCLTGLCTLLLWKGLSHKNDPVCAPIVPYRKALLLVCYAGTFFSPAFAVGLLFVFVRGCSGWMHHSQMLVRLLLGLLTVHLVLAVVAALHLLTNLPSLAAGSTAIVLAAIWMAHYLRPAWCKIRLSRDPTAWLRGDPLESLITSAYTWGWCRFLPERTVIRVAKTVRRIGLPFKAATLVVEFAAAGVLFSREFSCAVLVSLALFHVGIFLCSGIFFGENCLLGLFLAVLGSQAPETIFGLVPACAALGLSLFAMRFGIFLPHKLAWWDSPLAGRVHWRVKGDRGTYELYNDEMGPHERTFGRMLGFALLDEPLPYYHLGEIPSEKVWRVVMGALAEPATLSATLQKHGKVSLRPRIVREHDRYLAAFMRNGAARGAAAKKPRWMQWFLPFPGGQWYYWGEFEPFRFQDTPREVSLVFEEWLFAEDQFTRVRSRVLRQVSLGDGGN